MSKYSFEEKKKLVMAYLNGEGGTDYLTEKYGYANHSQLQRWVAVYQKFGDTGLLRSRKNEVYSFEKKLSVVELYLSSEILYHDLATQEGIPNVHIILRMEGLWLLQRELDNREKSPN